MSHYLETMNEDAARAIDTPPELPDIGTIVVYVPRAGVMRMHRREFPAIVLAQNYEEQTLELFVMMEPEDMMLEQHVAFQSHNQPHHCWRYVRKPDQESVAENSRMGAYGDRLSEVENVVLQLQARLKALIYGDYNPLDKSVYDVMADFESRLAALAKTGGKKGK